MKTVKSENALTPSTVSLNYCIQMGSGSRNRLNNNNNKWFGSLLFPFFCLIKSECTSIFYS